MRLLIVEDEPDLGTLVRDALLRTGFAADLVTGIGDAEDHLGLVRYDAMILDLGLADGDGMTLLRALRRRGTMVPVLILTARDAPEDRVAGLDTGADDYLVKPFHMPELVSRMRALLRRPNAALGVVLELGDLVLDTASRQARVGDTPLVLSLREMALLELLLRRQGCVVARETIEQGCMVSTPRSARTPWRCWCTGCAASWLRRVPAQRCTRCAASATCSAKRGDTAGLVAGAPAGLAASPGAAAGRHRSGRRRGRLARHRHSRGRWTTRRCRRRSARWLARCRPGPTAARALDLPPDPGRGISAFPGSSVFLVIDAAGRALLVSDPAVAALIMPYVPESGLFRVPALSWPAGGHAGLRRPRRALARAR